jgi:protein-disulfide isomerase
MATHTSRIVGALIVALLLAGGPSPGSAQDTITREQADTLIREIRELRRAIEGLRAPRAGAERPPDEKVRVDLTGVNVLGRADAPVTMVEFTDLECPYCRAFHVGAFERLKRLLDINPHTLRARMRKLGVDPDAFRR